MSRYRVYYTQTIGEEDFRSYYYSTSGYKDVEAIDKKHAFMRFQNEMLKFGVENFKTFKITDIQDAIDVVFASSYHDYFSDNTWEYHSTAGSTINIGSAAVETTMAPANTIYYTTYYTTNSWTTNA